MSLDMFDYAFMQRALLAALLVGLTAPMVGVHLVQRQLALIGDGLGHVALAGVALGLLTGTSPIGVALVVSVTGAVAVELVRTKAPSGGNTALALMFYGGIAAGVVLMARAPNGSAAQLTAYLFGSITTTTSADLVTFGILAALVVLVTVVGGRLFLTVGLDEEYSAATGLPVQAVNLILVALTATTVVIAMRVVGLLLISALMIIPVATSQLVATSFRATRNGAMALGAGSAVAGVAVSFSTDTPSGGTIVLIAIAAYVVVGLVSIFRRSTGRPSTAVGNRSDASR